MVFAIVDDTMERWYARARECEWYDRRKRLVEVTRVPISRKYRVIRQHQFPWIFSSLISDDTRVGSSQANWRHGGQCRKIVSRR